MYSPDGKETSVQERLKRWMQLEKQQLAQKELEKKPKPTTVVNRRKTLPVSFLKTSPKPSLKSLTDQTKNQPQQTNTRLARIDSEPKKNNNIDSNQEKSADTTKQNGQTVHAEDSQLARSQIEQEREELRLKWIEIENEQKRLSQWHSELEMKEKELQEWESELLHSDRKLKRKESRLLSSTEALKTVVDEETLRALNEVQQQMDATLMDDEADEFEIVQPKAPREFSEEELAVLERYRDNLDNVKRAQLIIRNWLFRRRAQKLHDLVKLFQTSDAAKTARQRLKAVREILESERSYVRDLETCINEFLKPLRSQDILSREDLSAIFTDLELIFQLNSQFLHDLDARLGSETNVYRSDSSNDVSKGNNANPMFHVGDIFLRILPMLNLYSRYITGYGEAIEAKRKAVKKHEDFGEFLKELKDKRHLDLDSYLIMPVQRLPRYQLLLQVALQYTPEDHVDHANLTESLAQIKEILQHINQTKKEQDIQDSARRTLSKQRKSFIVSSLSFDRKGKMVEARSSKMHVTVAKGKDLLGMDDNGLSDPYVVLKMKDQQFKTKAKKKTLTPEWNEDFVFVVNPSDEECSKIQCDVFDRDRGKKDDHIGACVVDFSGFRRNDTAEKWYKLSTLDNQPAGHIQLRITLL